MFLKWLKVVLLIFLAGFHCFRLFHMLFPNMLLWLSLPGLIQHLCSASIIRNIVSACIASFSAVGSVCGCCLVWVFEVLCSPGALQGAQTCGSAPSVASAVTAPVGHPGLLCASQLVQKQMSSFLRFGLEWKIKCICCLWKAKMSSVRFGVLLVQL